MRLRLRSQRGLRRIGASRERDAASASRNCAAVKADFGSRGSPMRSDLDHPVATDTRAHGERQVAKDELEIGDLQTFGRHSDFAVGREPRFLETGADRRPCVVSGDHDEGNFNPYDLNLSSSSLSDWHFRRGLGRAAGDFGELRRPSRLDRLHSRLSGRSGVASEACSAGWDAWGTVRRGRGRGRTSA